MASMPFALSVHNLISSVGADAGFASVIGLAILVLLYFSHARETANLRQEAAELATRLQEAEARLDAARRVQAAPEPEPAAAASAALAFAPAGMAAPALASATRFIPVISPSLPLTAPRPRPAVAPALASAVASRVPSGAPPTPAPPATPAPSSEPVPAPQGPATPVPSPPQPASRPPDPTPVPVTALTPAPATVAAAARPTAANPAAAPTAGPSRPAEPAPAANGATAPPPVAGGDEGTLAEAPIREAPVRVTPSRPRPVERQQYFTPPPARRSPNGRRFAVLLVGLLVIGAAAAVLIVTSGTGTQKPASPGNTPSPTSAAFNPANVTVAVLNGTATNQLAHRVAARLAADGYQQGPIATASNQTVATTIVAFLPGAANRTDALHVARTLHLPPSSVSPIDQDAEAVACPPPGGCTANVVVTVGADLAQT